MASEREVRVASLRANGPDNVNQWSGRMLIVKRWSDVSSRNGWIGTTPLCETERI